MNLYSVTKFHLAGNAQFPDWSAGVKHDRPYLVTDYIKELQRYREHISPEEFSKPIDLQVGQSHVISLDESKGPLITLGVRIKRLPDYQSGAILYDAHAKEFVQVSNGKCILAHDSPESYKAAHEANGNACQYAPSEAIALRPVLGHDGKVTLAWTYRAVDPCNLERPVGGDDDLRARFQAVLRKRRSARFIGRI